MSELVMEGAPGTGPGIVVVQDPSIEADALLVRPS